MRSSWCTSHDVLDGSAPLSLAMARRSDLSARVSALLDGRRRRSRAGGASIAAVWAAAAILVGALAPLHAVASRPAAASDQGVAGEKRRASSADRALYRAAERGNIQDIEQLLKLAGTSIVYSKATAVR